MNKKLVFTFAIATLHSSVALTDTRQLSAFQNIETAAVSATELIEVSGEGTALSVIFETRMQTLADNAPDIARRVTLMHRGINIDLATMNTGINVTSTQTPEQRINASLELMNASLLIYR